MRLAVMQPYFLPYIGYFQLISVADKFILLDDVNFINRGWINRNRLLIDGEPSLFTIPLQKASQNKLINEIKVTPDTKWRKKLLKTIQLNYKKAPFFDEVYSLLSGLLHSNIKNIAELNFLSIQQICFYLKIKTSITPNSNIYNNQHLNGQERIIDMCKQEKADMYINPIGGEKLYDKKKFFREGIQLSFLNTISEPYSQFKHPFVPNLSILDVIMFCKPEVIRNKHLNKYELL